MWMGGVAPLGYAAQDRKLIVVPEEAQAVRRIFARYRELGSVRRLKQELDKAGIRSKQRIDKNGCHAGGDGFAAGAVFSLLADPTFFCGNAPKRCPFPRAHP